MAFRQIVREADDHADGKNLVWQLLEDLAYPGSEGVARIGDDAVWAQLGSGQV
jgi:hypothetical protein